MLSGYQGGEDIGEMILDAVALVKRRNPAAIYAATRCWAIRIVVCTSAAGIPETDAAEGRAGRPDHHSEPVQLESLTGCRSRPWPSTAERGRRRAVSARMWSWSPAWYAGMGRRGDRHGCRQRRRGLACDDAATSQTFTGSGDVTAATFLASSLLGRWDVPQHSRTPRR